jgi:GDP-6-deoxy-D-talose 4-dehydrogenase
MASRSNASGRVLVTGLSGFTGRYVAASLLARGYEVVDPAAFGPFDLGSAESVDACVNAARADYVVHLAAISFVGHGEASDFYRVNCCGTVNLLEALHRSPTPLRKVVIASSANVYGNAAVSPITEATAPQPVNHYGCSKLAMEMMVRQWFPRLPIVVTRPFNYTGRGQASQFLVPKIVSHFARRAPEIELGNLDVSRDFSDVRDFADLYAALLDAPITGEIINLCSGQAYSLQWIITTCAKITGHSLEIKVNPAFVRTDELKVLVGSNAQLMALLGSRKTISFHETLRGMLSEVSVHD